MNRLQTSSRRLLVAFAAFSLIWFAVSYPLRPNLSYAVRDWTISALYNGWALAVGGLALAVVIRRRDRFWSSIAVAVLAMAAGDTLWDANERGLIGFSPVTVSLMDLFYIPGYLAIFFTIFRLVRRYNAAGGAGHTVDTVIAAGGVAAACFPLAVQPYADSFGGSGVGNLLVAVYPALDLMLTAAFVVAALTPQMVRPVRILGLAIALCLAADHIYVIQDNAGSYEAGGWLDWLWLTQYTLMAVTVTYPAPRKSVSAEEPSLRRRLLLIIGCAMLCPALLLPINLGGLDVSAATQTVYVVATFVLLALVCARLVLILADNARTVAELSSALQDRAQLSSELEYQARHDVVTGLPNRYALTERASSRSPDDVAAIGDGAGTAVIYLDIDDFKRINDTYGHAVGDLVLREVATRLQAVCRPEDSVARLGGDEFAVLLPGSTDSEAASVADRLHHVLRDPLSHDGKVLALSASIGVSRLRGESGRYGDALAEADLAMYAAKRAGKNRVLVFADDMRERALRDASLAADLVRAIDEREIGVAYQPIVHLASQRITGLEALARWNHPEQGPISPAVFLPLALERGLVGELDLLVLDSLLDRLVGWRRQVPDLIIGFNASAALLAADDVCDRVVGALDRHGLGGDCLVIEVTEQSVIEDVAGAAVKLQMLRDSGMTVALDDFGTGYSSLSYLQSLPIDVLKLDRSFLADAVNEGEVSPLLRGVVGLGRVLGLRVLVEGIETTQQFEAIRSIGCDYGQGYLLSRPLAPERVEAALSEMGAAAILVH